MRQSLKDYERFARTYGWMILAEVKRRSRLWSDNLELSIKFGSGSSSSGWSRKVEPPAEMSLKSCLRELMRTASGDV